MAGKVWTFHAEHTAHRANNSNSALSFGEQEVTIDLKPCDLLMECMKRSFLFK